MGLNVVGVDASERFYEDLKGVTDPERKRKIIGKDFVEVFNAEAKKIENARWLAQGTIYPDVIESCSVKGPVSDNQESPQRRRSAQRDESQDSRAIETTLQRRSAQGRQSNGDGSRLLGRHPFPSPRSGHPHNRRGNSREKCVFFRKPTKFSSTVFVKPGSTIRYGRQE